MNKKQMTEADIRSKFISPAILGEGGGKWDLQTQVAEEHYFTRGRVLVRGKTVKQGEAGGAGARRTAHGGGGEGNDGLRRDNN
jgi:type I site-specific restriction endonuclease